MDQALDIFMRLQHMLEQSAHNPFQDKTGEVSMGGGQSSTRVTGHRDCASSALQLSLSVSLSVLRELYFCRVPCPTLSIAAALFTAANTVHIACMNISWSSDRLSNSEAAPIARTWS